MAKGARHEVKDGTLRITLEAQQTPAGVRGTSEDVYSAAVAALAAVIGGNGHAIFLTKGWTVKARLETNYVVIEAVPDEGPEGRAAIRRMVGRIEDDPRR